MQNQKLKLEKIYRHSDSHFTAMFSKPRVDTTGRVIGLLNANDERFNRNRDIAFEKTSPEMAEKFFEELGVFADDLNRIDYTSEENFMVVEQDLPDAYGEWDIFTNEFALDGSPEAELMARGCVGRDIKRLPITDKNYENFVLRNYNKLSIPAQDCKASDVLFPTDESGNLIISKPTVVQQKIESKRIEIVGYISKVELGKYEDTVDQTVPLFEDDIDFAPKAKDKVKKTSDELEEVKQ